MKLPTLSAPGRQPPLRQPGGSSRPANNSSLFGSHPTAPNAPAFTFDSQGKYHVNTAQLADIMRRRPKAPPRQYFQPIDLFGRGRRNNRMLQLPQMQQMLQQQYYANAGGRGPGVSRQAALSMGASPMQARAAPGSSQSVSGGQLPVYQRMLGMASSPRNYQPPLRHRMLRHIPQSGRTLEISQ